MNTLKLIVKNIIEETSESKTFVLEREDKEKLTYKAGQFLTLLLNLNEEEIRRSYSFCSSPVVDQEAAITVKKIRDGKVSNYLNNELKIGDTLEVLPPAGNFTTDLQEKNKRHLILFGGGSGITPLMSILKSVLSKEPKSVVSLIYANRDKDTIIFKSKIEEIIRQFPKNFNVIHVLEQDPNNELTEFLGFLNPDLIKKVLKKLPNFWLYPTEYFTCGPNGMMEQVEAYFKENKINLSKLRKEVFSTEAAAKVHHETEGLSDREVTVHYAGETHKFMVGSSQTILEAAMELDIDLPYSCQSGMCTACMGKCTSGKVKLDDEDALTPKELQNGWVLTCVGHPMTDDVVIEIE